MNKGTAGIAIGMFAIGVGLGYVLWGTSGIPADHHTMPNGVMNQNIDRHFIVQMVPHHEGAIAMAKIALDRSKRPEIQSLARGIIEAQRKKTGTCGSGMYRGSALRHQRVVWA
jgi:hypothetical protein